MNSIYLTGKYTKVSLILMEGKVFFFYFYSLIIIMYIGSFLFGR